MKNKITYIICFLMLLSIITVSATSCTKAQDTSNEVPQDSDVKEITSDTEDPADPKEVAVTPEQLYLEKIYEYQDMYGKLSFTPMGLDNYEAPRGLIYADLIDFNSNGENELLLCYSGTDDYVVEVWSCDSGEMSCVYEGAPGEAHEGPNNYINVSEYDGKSYICEFSHPEYFDNEFQMGYEYFGFDGDKFELAKTLIHTSDEYCIDYENCTSEEYYQEEYKWNENSTYIEIYYNHLVKKAAIKATLSALGADITTEAPSQNSDSNDPWNDFIDSGKFYDYANRTTVGDDIRYAFCDADNDGKDELLIAITEGGSFFSTYMFSQSDDGIVLVDNRFGYGLYSYSSKFDSLLVSPELKPFSGAGSRPFYKYNGEELVFNFVIINDGDQYYCKDSSGEKEISDTDEYFSDVVGFDWVNINTEMKHYEEEIKSALLKTLKAMNGVKGTYETYEYETVRNNNIISFTVRYQMSDAEAEEIINNGGTPSANTIAGIYTVNAATGNIYDENGTCLFNLFN